MGRCVGNTKPYVVASGCPTMCESRLVWIPKADVTDVAGWGPNWSIFCGSILKCFWNSNKLRLSWVGHSFAFGGLKKCLILHWGCNFRQIHLRTDKNRHCLDTCSVVDMCSWKERWNHWISIGHWISIKYQQNHGRAGSQFIVYTQPKCVLLLENGSTQAGSLPGFSDCIY